MLTKISLLSLSATLVVVSGAPHALEDAPKQAPKQGPKQATATTQASAQALKKAPKKAPKKALSPAEPSLPDKLDEMLADHPIKMEDIDEPEPESLKNIINHLLDEDQGPVLNPVRLTHQDEPGPLQNLLDQFFGDNNDLKQKERVEKAHKPSSTSDHVKIKVHFPLSFGQMPSFSDLMNHMPQFPEIPQLYMSQFLHLHIPRFGHPSLHRPVTGFGSPLSPPISFGHPLPPFPEIPQLHMLHFPRFGHPSPDRPDTGSGSRLSPPIGFGHPFPPAPRAPHMPKMKINIIQRPEYIDTECFMDSVQFCRQTMQADDEHATRMCMMDHYQQVSPVCQKSLKKKGEETSDCLVEACHSQINMYCKAQSILCEDTLSCMAQHRDTIATDPHAAHCVAILDTLRENEGQKPNDVQSTTLHAKIESENNDSFSHDWMAALMGAALALTMVGAVSFVQRRREEMNDQNRYIPVMVDDGYDEYN